jgi:hypothetical protein
MSARTADEDGELRPAYRTLAEPSQLLGLSIGAWATVITAGAVGYGWLHLSPLPWRANASMVVIGLGAPVALLLLREASAISPARLLGAALRWRARPSRLTGAVAPRDGAVRLTTIPAPVASVEVADELPWLAPPSTASDLAPTARYVPGEPADPLSYRASDAQRAATHATAGEAAGRVDASALPPTDRDRYAASEPANPPSYGASETGRAATPATVDVNGGAGEGAS